MKNNRIIFILLVSLIGLASCEDYLDVSPDRGIDTEVVYSDYYSYKGAVDRGNWLIANYVASFMNYDPCNGVLSDEQQVQKYGGNSEQANKGVWQDLRHRDFGINFNTETDYSHGSPTFHSEPAGASMKAIRAMSIAIQNIDMLDDFPVGTGYTADQLRGQLLGQAYALRAWHQFEVIRRYGPILLVDTTGGDRTQFNPDFNFDAKRPSFQDCADLIAMDCDEAMALLPNKYDVATDVGRFTKTTAAAIKAMTYLYAASPLMNKENGDYPVGKDEYEEEYAQKGIDAMLEALALINSSDTRYKLYSKEDYELNFRCDKAVSDEALLQPPPTNKGGVMPMAWWSVGSGWFLPPHDGGWAVWQAPTQNAVDWFETTEGYPVNGFSSADPSFDPANPYDNRDPRLKIAIFCPNDVMYTTDKWVNKTAQTNEVWSNEAYNAEGKITVGYHYNKYSNNPYTGYFDGGKWRGPGNNTWEKLVASQARYFIYPHIRIPDMYLGLAELANEVYGPTTTIPGAGFTEETTGLTVNTAEDALNVIRNRAGMPNVRSEFVNQDDFRDRVRNEWAVEFYGEFRRWKDIRRWRIAKDVLAKGIYGVSAIKNDKGTPDVSDDTFTYTSKKIDNAYRVFEDKHYWYPFPNDTKDMFVVFEQNPGW